MVMSYWICAFSLFNKQYRKYFSIGFSAVLYSILAWLRVSVDIPFILDELLYWTEFASLLALCQFAIFQFRRGSI